MSGALLCRDLFFYVGLWHFSEMVVSGIARVWYACVSNCFGAASANIVFWDTKVGRMAWKHRRTTDSVFAALEEASSGLN